MLSLETVSCCIRAFFRRAGILYLLTFAVFREANSLPSELITQSISSGHWLAVCHTPDTLASSD